MFTFVRERPHDTENPEKCKSNLSIFILVLLSRHVSLDSSVGKGAGQQDFYGKLEFESGSVLVFFTKKISLTILL